MKKFETYAKNLETMTIADVLNVLDPEVFPDYNNYVDLKDELASKYFNRKELMTFSIVNDLAKELNNKLITVKLDCNFSGSNYVKRAAGYRFDYISIVYNDNARRAFQTTVKCRKGIYYFDSCCSAEKRNREKFENSDSKFFIMKKVVKGKEVFPCIQKDSFSTAEYVQDIKLALAILSQK